jgi:ectoine hydroxylase-related dioxygenase (phytanoyl-CoA dioxygenase family)
LTTRTEETGLLGPTELEQFERDGFVVFDPGVTLDLIDAVRSDMEALYRLEGDRFYQEDGVTYWAGSRPRIMDSWRIANSSRSLALAPRVLAVTEQLFGRKPLPFQTLNFKVGTEQPPHMDSTAFYSDPPDYMCGVWVALEDMDMDNGPLVYYPGSHKVARPAPWEEVARDLGEKYVAREDYPNHQAFSSAREAQWYKYTAKLIADHGLKPAYGTIKKGQALLWAANLFHGGSPQRDQNRTRHSQVTHYFFEGCRHYSPMRTQGDHIFWDYKAWVRDPPPRYSAESVHAAIREHVTPGAIVLVAVHSPADEMLEMEGFDTRGFDIGKFSTEEASNVKDGKDAVAELERTRSEAAQYAVFPLPTLWWLENSVPALQDKLEFEHRAVLRDGAICAIYALD